MSVDAASNPTAFANAVEGVSRLGTSRCGLASWRGRIEGREVKIYETHSSDQAEWIEWVSTESEVAGQFPEIVGREEHCLAVEWVAGEALPKGAFRSPSHELTALARFQARLHSMPLPDASEPFSYCDHLLERLARHESELGGAGVRERLSRELQEPPSAPRRPSHPDLTPQNLVPAGTSFRVIDNELLSHNVYAMVDLLNTHRVFGRWRRRSTARAYIAAYLDGGGDLGELVDDARFFNALWDLRSIGSRLQNGEVRRAKRIADAALAGGRENQLIEVAREILGR